MPPSDACMYCSHPEDSRTGFGEAWHLLFLANTSTFKDSLKSLSWLRDIPCGRTSQSPRGAEDLSDAVLKGSNPNL